jgi:hypothetical protein
LIPADYCCLDALGQFFLANDFIVFHTFLDALLAFGQTDVKCYIPLAMIFRIYACGPIRSRGIAIEFDSFQRFGIYDFAGYYGVVIYFFPLVFAVFSDVKRNGIYYARRAIRRTGPRGFAFRLSVFK